MEIDELAVLLGQEESGLPKGERPPVCSPCRHLKAGDLKLFAEVMKVLLEGGVPILKALEGLEKASRNRKFKNTLTVILENIRQGRGFSEALEKTRCFPVFFHQMVSAGEAAGAVPEVLKELAVYLEKEQTLKGKIREALAYPALILCLGFTTLGVLLNFVLPKLRSIYDGFGADLPLITKVILRLSDFFLPSAALGIACLTLSFLFLRKKEHFVFVLYHVPLAGPFIRGLTRVQFSRLLSLLLESGIPLLEGLEIVGKTLSSSFLREDAASLKERLMEGHSFSNSLEGIRWVDPLSRMLAASGEETGRLSSCLAQIARDTEESLEAQIRLIVKLLEPGLILGIGILVGIVVIGTVLPIFDLSGLAQ